MLDYLKKYDLLAFLEIKNYKVHECAKAVVCLQRKELTHGEEPYTQENCSLLDSHIY